MDVRCFQGLQPDEGKQRRNAEPGDGDPRGDAGGQQRCATCASRRGDGGDRQRHGVWAVKAEEHSERDADRAPRACTGHNNAPPNAVAPAPARASVVNTSGPVAAGKAPPPTGTGSTYWCHAGAASSSADPPPPSSSHTASSSNRPAVFALFTAIGLSTPAVVAATAPVVAIAPAAVAEIPAAAATLAAALERTACASCGAGASVAFPSLGRVLLLSVAS